MIPIQLSLNGFLSYHDPVEIDFTGFDLACISGPNGAGKSSLLDAITWALFGQARRRDDALINNQSEVAEVSLVYAYEGSIYRVQRANPRGKTTMLEFHIFQGEDREVNADALSHGAWKPLTERTLRETQARIEAILRLDYDTFVNASFFLQGQADQFTQQRPGDRKRILSNILGLEVWETYRQRALERRKSVEGETGILDGQLKEINDELAQEKARKARLQELQNDLEHLTQARTAQEASLESIRAIAASLAEQRKMLDTLGRQVETSSRSLQELETRAALRGEERAAMADVIARADAIQSAYQDWQTARQQLEAWEKIAAHFREHEKQRQGPLDEINAARARLTQELETLKKQEAARVERQASRQELKAQLAEAEITISVAEGQLAQRETLDMQLQEARQKQSDAKAENPRLKAEMTELKERIDELREIEGAVCPLCGQALRPEDRQRLIDELSDQGKEKGDRYRTNQTLLQESGKRVGELEANIAQLSQADSVLRTHTQKVAQISAQLEQYQQLEKEWSQNGAPRLAAIATQLEQETFAPDARARLAGVDAELKAIGYDATAHDAARQAESQGRSAEEDLRALEKAQAALAPLERELADLQKQIIALNKELSHQQAEHDQAATSLATAEAQAPDLPAAERELLEFQEQENQLRLEVGAARQNVLVLDDLKTRRKSLEARREELSRLVSQYRQLERAFGKDGVPALLIEQALPQIEVKANEILERLSDGNMSVRFVTQTAYKDRRRDDLKETLDIQISDSAGTRAYEMYSGGEAFRVNFAIRLALAEVLAQRAGARLQTLVIDEGFGSQDTLGRQRLIEAINLVRQDFAKILVITHIDELKEAFPTRIEVQKSGQGSQVRII